MLFVLHKGSKTMKKEKTQKLRIGHKARALQDCSTIRNSNIGTHDK